MSSFTLFYLDASERGIWEAECKGYKNDVYVEIQEEYFHLHVYDKVRIIQDFDEEYKQYGYFQIEPNLILVASVNETEISNTIGELLKVGFFQNIKPVRNEEVESLQLTRIK